MKMNTNKLNPKIYLKCDICGKNCDIMKDVYNSAEY